MVSICLKSDLAYCFSRLQADMVEPRWNFDQIVICQTDRDIYVLQKCLGFAMYGILKYVLPHDLMIDHDFIFLF